jgi:hypothetical protein
LAAFDESLRMTRLETHDEIFGELYTLIGDHFLLSPVIDRSLLSLPTVSAGPHDQIIGHRYMKFQHPKSAYFRGESREETDFFNFLEILDRVRIGLNLEAD